MLPIVETNGKTLYINSNKVTFPYKIEQVLILKSQILILLDSCIKNEYDNVYSVNFDGTIGWRVQSRKYLSREYENKKLTSYVGMYVRKETNLLQLNDWWGGRYIFDLNEGHIVGRDESGRDW